MNYLVTLPGHRQISSTPYAGLPLPAEIGANDDALRHHLCEIFPGIEACEIVRESAGQTTRISFKPRPTPIGRPDPMESPDRHNWWITLLYTFEESGHPHQWHGITLNMTYATALATARREAGIHVEEGTRPNTIKRVSYTDAGGETHEMMTGASNPSAFDETVVELDNAFTLGHLTVITESGRPVTPDPTHLAEITRSLVRSSLDDDQARATAPEQEKEDEPPSHQAL